MVEGCELTGYIQRKLVKFLEDIKVEYDGTVRNANDKIIQCIYGDNGVNTERQTEQKIDLISADNETVRSKFVYSTEEMAELRKKKIMNEKYTNKLNDAHYDKLIAMRDHIRQLQRKTNISSISFKDMYMLPVDLKQFIINITSRDNRDDSELIDPYEVIATISKMYNDSENKFMKFLDSSIIKKNDEKRIKLILKIYLYDQLSPKRCTHEYKLSKSEFYEIYKYFTKTVLLSKVEGGEMVGIIAAQSIGEPVTQTNLKSFHKSGTGKTVSGGLVRVKELLGVSKEIKTPVSRIVLKKEYMNDKVIAKKIASSLRYTIIKDVIESINICYDPNPSDKKSVMHTDGVTEVYLGKKGNYGCQDNIQGLPWIIRMILSKEKMIEYNISMLEIKTSFCNNWAGRIDAKKNILKDYKKIIDKITQCAIVSNFDNSDTPIIHIRFNAMNYNITTMIQFQEMIVNKFKIKGIDGIYNTDVNEESYISFEPDGKVLNKKQLVINTDGINLRNIVDINGIDLSESICNHVVRIFDMYGVEAAKSAFIREFTKAIESSGGFSNYQHITILADAVTHMGGLIPVDRHGANKLDTDPFSRASFEKTSDQMIAAAVFGESDHIRSVSARIMVGDLINGGTGAFDLIINHPMIKSLVTTNTQGSESSQPIVLKKSSVADLIKKKKSTK